MLEINWPAVITTTNHATTLPLTHIGDTSDKYTGTIIDAIPTPNPTIILPNINAIIVWALHITIAPIKNNKSDIIIIGLRPNESARGPAIKDPKNAPSKAIETISSL